jgi:amino acid transporter
MSSTSTPTGPGLRDGCLSFWQVTAQSIANISPSSSPTLLVPLVFVSAGSGTWIAFLFATVALYFVASNINRFATRSASPGALYTFASQGLGPFGGVVAGAALVIAYLFTAAAVMSGAVIYAEGIWHAAALPGTDHVLALPLVGLGIGVAWYLAYRDIRVSTNALLVLEFATLLTIVGLCLIVLLHSTVRWDPAQLSLHGATTQGIRLGLVLAIFGFVGFESATVLGQEASEPHRTIPRAVLASFLLVGAFFIFVSYVEVLALRDHQPPLSELTAPLAVLAEIVGIPGLGFVLSGVVVVALFACALASLQAAARVIFELARRGLVHSAASRAHLSNATPHVALAAGSASAFAMVAAMVGDGFSLLDTFTILGTIATFAFLLVYIMVSVAAPLFLRSRGEDSRRAWAVAAIAVVLLMVPVVGSLYPVPPPPLNLLPYVFLALMGLMVGSLYWRQLRPQGEG